MKRPSSPLIRVYPLPPRPPPRPPRRGESRPALRARAIGHDPCEARGRRRLAGRRLPPARRPSTAPTAVRGPARASRCAPIRPARRLVRRLPRTAATTGPSRCPAPRATRRCGGTTTSTTSSSTSPGTAGPIRAGRGSAIFLHLAGPGFAPTAGCVAVERRMRPAPPGADRARDADRDRGLRALSRLSRPEDRAAHAHMGRAELDRGLEIGAHAHRELPQPVAPGNSCRSAKCGEGGSSAGGMHIRPSIGRP